MNGDGNGWITCAAGEKRCAEQSGAHKHWGVHGAAGLLISVGDRVLVQLRADWTHHGGTWGIPGGARDSHESVVEAAIREATEETDLEVDALRLTGTYVDDRGGWSYTTVLAHAASAIPVAPINAESLELRWAHVDDLAAFPMAPGFALSWPVVRNLRRRVVLVVDAANVVGSRPDGWWHDRLGATRRLRDQLATLQRDGIPAADVRPELDHCYPDVVLVVEGAARPLADEASPVTVVAAAHGDDGVVAAARAHATEHCVVVTADRELRARCSDLDVVGPARLLSHIDSAGGPRAH